MTKREAAQKLFDVLQQFPPDRRPFGMPHPLTVEALEGTIERKHLMMGEESLKTHPLYPPGLRGGWLRVQTERERLYLAQKEAQRAEMERRQAELDKK
jgi:hypothetical protein